MDKSMNSRNVRHATFHKYQGIYEYFIEEEDDKDQSESPNNEAQYDETESNKKHNNEKQKNVTQAVNSDKHDKNDETQSRNDELINSEKQIDESLNSNIQNNSILLNTWENKKEIGRENEFETLALPDYESDDNDSNIYDFRFLDPDDINMNKYNKRFQKMIKFNIPTTFSCKKKSENKVNSSFHIRLFQDLYLHLNTYRKKKEISDDVIMPIYIPCLYQLDHLIDDIPTLDEASGDLPFHTIDDDGELIAFYNNIQNDESYLMECSQMIEKMVDSGEKRVI